MNDLPTNVDEEIKDAREAYPQINIQTATSSFLTGSYQRTTYTRIKFTLTFPFEYPDHGLIIDIASVRFQMTLFYE